MKKNKLIENKKKILFFDFNLQFLFSESIHPVGGSAQQQYSWTQGLLKNNCIPGVFVFSNNYIDRHHSKNIHFLRIYNSNKGIRKIRIFYYRIPILIKAIKDFKPDHIYQACAGFETGLAAILSKLFKIPFIYRVANDTDTDGRYKNLLSSHQKLFYHFGLRHASHVVCQNNYQFNNLKKMGVKGKMKIIHNPFYFNDLIPTEVKPLCERNYISWIGIFQRQKNLMGLYDIVAKLPWLQFKIAGTASNKNLDPNTKKALSLLKKCTNVEFDGYVTGEKKYAFLANSIALLNTSHHEGFSNTFLEAFAFGTPVITTSKVDPDNIIADNTLGFVREDIDDLVNDIKNIFHVDYSTISNNCRKYLIENHNPENLSSELLKFIE